MTVVRKLPTIVPTAVIMAMAVASAPTSTDVRRSEPRRLREASKAATPVRFKVVAEIFMTALIAAGKARGPAEKGKNAAGEAENGLSPNARGRGGGPPRAGHKNGSEQTPR